MTEFRSKGKGKERKVYPVKRQPYGISRELAYKDVQELREKGKRARLIETNKRLDLYAPYESDLPTPDIPVPQNTPMEMQENNPVPEYKAEPEQKSEPPMQSMAIPERKAQPILESLGILNDKGKINLTKRVFQDYLESGDGIIRVEGGRLEFMALDHSRVSLVQKRTFTTLPDGEYVIKGGVNGPVIETATPKDVAGFRMKMPNLDYEKQRSTYLNLGPEQLKEFLRAVDRAAKSGENLKFKATGREGLDVMAKKEVLYHYDGKVDYELVAIYDSEYLSSLIKIVVGNKEYRNPKDISLTLSMRNDYPLKINYSMDGKTEPVETIGLIAPRME